MSALQKWNVLVLIPCEPRHRDLLRAAAPQCEFRFKGASSLRDGGGLIGGQLFPELLDEGLLTPADAAWAQVILGNPSVDFLRGANSLVWLQTSSAGVEAYVRPGALPPGVLLTNATGAYGLAISEHLLGMLLTLFKKLELYRDAQKDGSWAPQGAVRSVYGCTLLVLGMGDIGGEFAKRCKALGAFVIGVRRKNREKPDYADEIHLIEDLDRLLPRADVVAIALPGTAGTQGLICRERIEKMKDGACLLNVGRGSIVDTEALCDALESGKLSGAGLDVTDPEPLPPDHRLWRIPTAVITPHVSGFYHLRETHERIIGICEENLRWFLAGKPLINQVDFSTGYRRS